MRGSPMREPEESGTASPAHGAAGGEPPGSPDLFIESVDADGTSVSTRRVWVSVPLRHPLRAALKSGREGARGTCPQAVAGITLAVVVQFEAPYGRPSSRRAVRRLVGRLERAAGGGRSGAGEDSMQWLERLAQLAGSAGDAAWADLKDARRAVIAKGPTGADAWLASVGKDPDRWREAAASVLLRLEWEQPMAGEDPVVFFDRVVHREVGNWRAPWERKLRHEAVALLSEPVDGGEGSRELVETVASSHDVAGAALDGLEVSGHPCVLRVTARLKAREARIADVYARGGAAGLTWARAGVVAGQSEKAGRTLEKKLVRLGTEHAARARAAWLQTGFRPDNGCAHWRPGGQVQLAALTTWLENVRGVLSLRTLTARARKAGFTVGRATLARAVEGGVPTPRLVRAWAAGAGTDPGPGLRLLADVFAARTPERGPAAALAPA